MTQKHTTKDGFSILETMIASFVLVVGLAGAITVFGPAVQFTGASRDQAIAAALAQEGVELIKNVRDNNMLGGSFNDHMNADGTYCMDYNDTAPSSCGSGQLYISGNWYVHNATSTRALFKRKIYIDNRPGELAIKSYVVWRDGRFPASLANPASCTLVNKCAFAQTVLTDWK